MVLLRKTEVSLMVDQSGVGEQKAEGIPPESPMKPRMAHRTRAATAYSTGEMVTLEVGFEQKSWNRVEKDPAVHLDEVKVHSLRNDNLPIEQQLVVQWMGRTGSPGDP